jgi:hypothetical protein
MKSATGTWIGKILISLGLAAAAVIAVNCSSGGSSSSPPAGQGASTVGVDLRIGRTTQIQRLKYTLTGPNGFSASGSIAVNRSKEAEGSIQNIPVGSPYTLALAASSTDGNVTCTGSKSGISVACPGDRPQDEKFVKMTCSRNHLGREWGDRDWQSNMKTFFLVAEINLDCQPPSPDGGSDSCVPLAQARACGDAGGACGTAPDGCGGSVSCGTCASNFACVVADGSTEGTCVCVPKSMSAACGSNTCGTAPDGCGGTVDCGGCSDSTSHCNVADGGSAGVCCPTQCPPLDNCGTVSAPGCPTIHCGTCCPGAPANCLVNSGQTAGVCECIPRTFSQSCGDNNCGYASDGCCGTVSCGTCTVPTSCNVPDGGTAGTCACTPNPVSVTCGNDLCGTKVDNCGNVVTCGGCPSGQACVGSPKSCNGCLGPTDCGTETCGSLGGTNGCPLVSCGLCSTPPNLTCKIIAGMAGTCVCTPEPDAAACGSSNCGSAVNNCGTLVSCGTCASPTPTCSTPDGGTAGTCVCIPRTQADACGSASCGNASDGCGGTISCGTCTGSSTCSNTTGGAGTCTPVFCDGSTAACLQAQDKPATIGTPTQCSTCVAANGCLDPTQNGTTCEVIPPPPIDPILLGVLPDGKMCSSVLGSATTHAEICLEVLDVVFTSKCGTGSVLLPCLCGQTPVQACESGTALPTGPLADFLACDFNTTSISTILQDSTVESFGAGAADSILQCAVQNGCDCF